MSPTTAHPQPATRRQRRAYCLALAAAAILAALAVTPASALAGQSGAPFIESVGSGAGGEVTIDAKINPEGLETSYEIGLECSPCGPGDQSAKGTLPAVDDSREVTLALSGLQPNRRYWFAVRAVNADGETSRRGETLEMPSSPAPFPNGTGGTGPVTAPYLGAASEQLKKIAEQEEERRAKDKEAEEQKARELTARPASELEHTEQPPAIHAKTELLACVVPVLKGDTLSAARRALATAHCRLGKISRPAHQHSVLRVIRQSTRHGKKLPSGAAVAVELAVTGKAHAGRP